MEQCECQKEDNENIEFIGVCQNNECEGDFYCEKCKGIHAGHYEDVLEGQEYEEFLEKLSSPEYQKEIEQQEVAEEFAEYYEKILNDNLEETKMFQNIVQYLKDENNDELVKLLDKIKQSKIEIDNNRPAIISKKMDEYRKRIKDLDDKYPIGDIQARQKKIELMNKGRQLYLSSDYTEALKHLQEAIAIDNDYIDALLIKGSPILQLLAQTLIQIENYDEAIICCNYVIQIDRLNGEAYYIKIIALFLGQRYDVILEELKAAIRKGAYKFFCNTLHLINQLEKTSPTVKQTVSQLNYNLKSSLQSLINYQEIPTQISQQYLTQLIGIIQQADQNEIYIALIQYNQNFEVLEEYQKQYDVDIRPKLDEKAWQEMVEFLENYKQNQLNNQAQAQPVQAPLVQAPLVQGGDNQSENQSIGQVSTQNPSSSLVSNNAAQLESQIHNFYQNPQQIQTGQSEQEPQSASQQVEAIQIPVQNPTQANVEVNIPSGGSSAIQTSENQEHHANEIQTLGDQSSNKIQSELSKFQEDKQPNQATPNEQQEQKPVEQITEQPQNQFVDQFNKFVQDASSNQITSNQEQPQAQSQTNQPPNQFKQQFDNFIQGTQPNQETPNEQQQINPQKEMAKIAPTPKVQQELSDFYKDAPQDQNNKPQEKAKQPAVAQGETPQTQQDLQNFLSGVEQQKSDKEEITLNETKRLQEILKYSDQIIKQGNAGHQIYFKKAMALKKLNEFEGALAILDEAISRNENEANYYYQKALLFILCDANELALINFDEAISRNPDEPCYYKEKGNELKRQDRLKEAENCFELAKQKGEAYQ